MPLKVIVVGAGIAGLCAGIALCQAGHEVEVCILVENSKLALDPSLPSFKEHFVFRVKISSLMVCWLTSYDQFRLRSMKNPGLQAR